MCVSYRSSTRAGEHSGNVHPRTVYVADPVVSVFFFFFYKSGVNSEIENIIFWIGVLLLPEAWKMSNLHWTSGLSHALQPSALHFTVLLSTALCCASLHCNVLHCIAPHCNALDCTAPHCNTLQYTALFCTKMHCSTLHCTTLHGTALLGTAHSYRKLGTRFLPVIGTKKASCQGILQYLGAQTENHLPFFSHFFNSGSNKTNIDTLFWRH